MFVYSARAHPLGIYSENLFSLEETVRGSLIWVLHFTVCSADSWGVPVVGGD